MKKVLNVTLAIVMTLGLVFIGDVVSSSNPLSVSAQTGQVTVRRTRRPGIIRSTARGAKYVGRKVYRGGRYVVVKSAQGTKYVAKKTYKGGRMVTSRAKKIIY